jgi:integrase
MANSTPFVAPPLKHHASTGRAYVRLDGRFHYFGKWGTPEAYQRHARFVAELAASGGHVLPPPDVITIMELCAVYIEHATAYYRNPDGTPTSSLDEIRQAFKPLKLVYGDIAAKDFGPIALKAVRDKYLESKVCRTTANARTELIKRAFKWAVENELIPAGVWHGLQAVSGLKRGRCEARETEPVRPVPQAHIDILKGRVTGQVWAMIQLQLHCGARPGEIVALRALDLDTSGKIWMARLAEHKTAYRGRERVLYFGPKCQAILKHFIQGRPLHLPIFSPKESEAERLLVLHAKRTTPLSCGNRPGTNRRERPIHTPGDSYTPNSYRRVIERAIERYNADPDTPQDKQIPNWSPNRLRHNYATNVRRKYGLDGAQAGLGHASANISQVYAEVDHARVMEIAADLG